MIKNEVILSAIYMIQDYRNGSHFLEETVDRVLTELKLLDKELEALQNSKVSSALKEWLNSQDDKDRTITYQGNKTYSADDLIQEIDNQTDVGKGLEQDIIALTIDLLFRKQEVLEPKEQ